MATDHGKCAQCAQPFDPRDTGPQGHHRYRQTTSCHACVSEATSFGADDSCEACGEPVRPGDSG